MSLDGFLTVRGLAAAIYAVVPAVARLRARLALWIQAPVAIARDLEAALTTPVGLVAQ